MQYSDLLIEIEQRKINTLITYQLSSNLSIILLTLGRLKHLQRLILIFNFKLKKDHLITKNKLHNNDNYNLLQI